MAGWVEIPGAELSDIVGKKHIFTALQGEFTARLATAGALGARFAVAIGDPADVQEGVAPDMWLGIVESWQPAGSSIRVVCRPARTVEECSGALLSTGGSAQIVARLGGVG